MQPVMERKYRRLTAEEVAQLERQGNRADDWGAVLVVEPFDAVCVQGNRFGGEVRIGALCRQPAEADGLREGIYDSNIVDTTIGDHARVHDVRMLRGYTVGDGVTLSCIDEISADGAPAPWLEPMNGRHGLPLGPLPWPQGFAGEAGGFCRSGRPAGIGRRLLHDKEHFDGAQRGGAVAS